MRAVEIVKNGGVAVRDRPDPVPDVHGVVVDVRAAGLNAADLQQARGDYPAPPGWPADVPGLEIAGVVSELGAAVSAVDLGDRVMALVGGGGHAERVAVPADLLVPVPPGLSWDEVGGFPEAFFTAWDGLVVQAGVRAGQRVLVTGAAGGVGTAMVQVAAAAGADVVAEVRRPELHEAVAALASGRVEVVTSAYQASRDAFDVIVELVGGADCLARVSRLRPGGSLLVIGVQTGSTASLPMFDLMLARGRIIGSTIRNRPHYERVRLTRSVQDLLVPLLALGRVRTVVDTVYELRDAARAFEHLAGPGKFGKLVFRPSSSPGSPLRSNPRRAR